MLLKTIVWADMGLIYSLESQVNKVEIFIDVFKFYAGVHANIQRIYSA
jgi:hypothetical protein